MIIMIDAYAPKSLQTWATGLVDRPPLAISAADRLAIDWDSNLLWRKWGPYRILSSTIETLTVDEKGTQNKNSSDQASLPLQLEIDPSPTEVSASHQL